MSTTIENPLIAVVLPVFNTADFLEECLSSLLDQTYQNFLIFAVDDASSDESPKILKKFQTLDSRLNVFSITHSGVSAARNFALRKIFTENLNIDLVCFVDSDDYVSSTFLEDYVRAIIDKNVDSVICGYQEFDVNGPLEEAKMPPFFDNRTISKEDNLDYILNNGNYRYTNLEWCPSIVANRCFKVKKIKNFYFDPDITFREDTDWLIRISNSIESGFISSKINYFYRQRSSSACHTEKISASFEVYLLSKYPELFIRKNMFYFWWICVRELCHNQEIKEYYPKVKKISKLFSKDSLSSKEKKRLFIFSLGPTLLSAYFWLQDTLKHKSPKKRKELF